MGWIEERIISEKRKHENITWQKIAEIKIRGQFICLLEELQKNILQHGEVNKAGDVDSHMVYVGDVIEELNKIKKRL